jgi:P27 family predicted phage terminase small subunit
MALRVLADTDAPTLALACAALAEYQQADAMVVAEGITLTRTDATGQKVVVRHPAVAIRADAWRRARDALRAFGLSPADRDRVAQVGDRKPVSKYARFRSGDAGGSA